MNTGATVKEEAREQASVPDNRYYRYYVLLILSLIYALSFLNRNIINVLLEPIKLELHASDTAMGALTGVAFAFMYAGLGIPIARWADGGNRRNIITLGLSVWSVMTALCGLTTNFWNLALARVGVGVGEAASGAPAQSLISDYFPKELRPRALAIFQSSIYLGVAGGYLVGGWVTQLYGWRSAFLVAGLPGLLLAVIFHLTVREPERGASDSAAARTMVQPRMREVLSFMAGQKAYVLVVLAVAIVGFSSYALSAWQPSLLQRIYHLSTGQLSTYLGLINAPCGVAGTLLGGFVTERFKSHDPRWLVWLPAIATALAFPVSFAFPLVNNLTVSLVCLAAGNVLVGFHLGPCWALCQNLVKPPMRALSAAICFVLLIILGAGMGPFTVGFLSDALRPHFAAASLRYATAGATTACLLGAVLMAAAANFLRDDLAKSER
jgi:MFS family permease